MGGDCLLCTRSRSRTDTSCMILIPKTSASANSAIRACTPKPGILTPGSSAGAAVLDQTISDCVPRGIRTHTTQGLSLISLPVGIEEHGGGGGFDTAICRFSHDRISHYATQRRPPGNRTLFYVCVKDGPRPFGYGPDM